MRVTLNRRLDRHDLEMLARCRPTTRTAATEVARGWIDQARAALVSDLHGISSPHRSVDMAIAYASLTTPEERAKGWAYVGDLQRSRSGPGGMQGADVDDLADILSLALDLTEPEAATAAAK